MEFSVGDEVLLSTENLVLRNQPSSKLKQRFIGPFKIEAKISSQAYRLTLPTDMKVHPVFHISLLKRYTTSDDQSPISDVIPAVQPLIRDSSSLTYVSKVLAHAVHETYKVYYHSGPALVSVWSGMMAKNLGNLG